MSCQDRRDALRVMVSMRGTQNRWMRWRKPLFLIMSSCTDCTETQRKSNPDHEQRFPPIRETPSNRSSIIPLSRRWPLWAAVLYPWYQYIFLGQSLCQCNCKSPPAAEAPRNQGPFLHWWCVLSIPLLQVLVKHAHPWTFCVWWANNVLFILY